jgi:hypothetical protein
LPDAATIRAVEERLGTAFDAAVEKAGLPGASRHRWPNITVSTVVSS